MGSMEGGFGVNLLSQVKSRGQTIEESAQMFNIISGNGTEAQNNVVCANAEWPCNDNENVHRSKDSK
jgi:hypothetical protein